MFFFTFFDLIFFSLVRFPIFAPKLCDRFKWQNGIKWANGKTNKRNNVPSHTWGRPTTTTVATVCTREKTKTNNQTKTNKICFEKETHDSLGNTTMTMSTRTTTTTPTIPSQVSYYRRVHSLPSISQQSKRGNVIDGARATGASKALRERRIDKSRKSNPIIFTISKIHSHAHSSRVQSDQESKKKTWFGVSGMHWKHCVRSTKVLMLRLRQTVELTWNLILRHVGGKGAKCRRWARERECLKFVSNLSDWHSLIDSHWYEQAATHLRRCNRRRHKYFSVGQNKCVFNMINAIRSNVKICGENF